MKFALRVVAATAAVLCIGSAFAQKDQWTLSALQDIKCTLDRISRWNLAWNWINDLEDGLLSFFNRHCLTEQLCG